MKILNTRACKKLIFLFMACVLISNFTFSQSVTTKGKDFWFGLMHNGPLGYNVFNIYISSASNSPVTGQVEIPGLNFTQNYTVDPDSSVMISLPSGVEAPYKDGNYKIAVHVTACDSVSVHASNSQSTSTDASVVYPTTALSDDYMILNWDQDSFPSSHNLFDGAQFLIVATEDSTDIEITPSIATGAGQAPNVPFTITLDKGEVYVVTNPNQNTNSGSFTGTTVKSVNKGTCKNFAVFSGNNGPYIGPCSSGDHIFSQITPLSMLDTSYFLIPLAKRSNTYYRIMATENNTSVTINGGTPFNLNQGQFHQFSNNTVNFVIAENPVMVMQFAQGQNCDSIGDPFQMTMYSKNAFVSNVTFKSLPTARKITDHWVNIITKTADVSNTVIDGVNIATNFSTIPSNTNYSYAQVSVTLGTHTLSNPGGFLAYAYGWGRFNSYGYCTAAKLVDKNNLFTINPNPTCIGSTINFTANDTTATSYTWDFGDSTGTKTGRKSSHKYNAEGAYTVTLIKGNASGCDAVLKQNVFIHRLPVKIIQNDTLLCKGDDILLSIATGDSVALKTVNDCGDTILVYNKLHYDSIAWSTGDTGQSINIRPIRDTIIYAYGFNSGALCSGMDSIILKVDHPEAQFSYETLCNDTVCVSDSSKSKFPISSRLWDFDDGQTSNSISPCHKYDSAGQYNIKLIIEDSLGCRDSISKNIEVPKTTDFTAKYFCFGDTVKFFDKSIPNPTSWNWDLGDGATSSERNPVHYYDKKGKYNVTLISNGECTDTISKSITIKECYEVLIPNVFTPNGDGKNDYFIIDGVGINQLDMSIFNRWGKLIYEGHGVDAKWDGLSPNGAKASPGSYMYIIIIKDNSNKTHKYTGNVILMR